MQPQKLSELRKYFAETKLQFFTDLYTKAIWGDME